MIRILPILTMLFAISTSAFADDDWRWQNERASILYYLAQKPAGFEVQLVRLAEWKPELDCVQVRIMEAGKVIHKWDAHNGAAFVFSGSTLVYSKHQSRFPGCELIAWDLRNARRLWANHLKGVPVSNGSQYSNRINLKIQGGEITVFGNEAHGQYIEKIDLESGRTTSHKLGTNRFRRFDD